MLNEKQRRKSMIYDMSDIHGQYELFERRMNQIRPFLSDGKGNVWTKAADVVERVNRV